MAGATKNITIRVVGLVVRWSNVALCLCRNQSAYSRGVGGLLLPVFVCDGTRVVRVRIGHSVVVQALPQRNKI